MLGERSHARASGWKALGLAIGLLLAVGAFGAARPAAAHAAPSVKRAPVLTFYFGLKRPEAKAVAAFWAVQRPGSASYRRFLGPAQVARRYGASRQTRRAFVVSMRRLGLSASVDPSGVFARVRGTKTRLEHVFHVKITSTFDDLATTYTANRPLRLPAGVKPLVREVIASSDRTTLHPGELLSPLAAAPSGPTNLGRWIGGCAAARRTGGYAYAQIRHAYGLTRVGSGAGGSIAILNDQETVDPSDASAMRRCFGYPAGRVRSLFTDGQTHRFQPQTPEPPEDLALARGVAPQSTVMQTQVWGTPALWFLGPAKLLTQRRLPDALSISYGYCERDVMSNALEHVGSRLLNAMFVRLGLAGVGVFGSAGDSGSTCNGKQHLGTAWPADSPYVTSVGGTRLVVDHANRRVREVVWNDLRWLKPSKGGGAGGGGLASYRRPPYQRGLRVAGDKRATPDIAVHGSMLPGYPIRANGQWILDAGTSAAAPLAAAAFTAISARLQARGKPPLGPVDGLLYWLARHHRRGALYDIVVGDNRYDRKVPGYHAHRGYDLASGLGVPQFARIAATVPAPAHR